MKHNLLGLFGLSLLMLILTLACGISSQPTRQVNPVGQSVITPVVVYPTLPSLTTDEDAILVDLYNRLNPSVVSIFVYVSDGGVLQMYAQASGFVFDNQGHIVTNAHVVHGADSVEVNFNTDTIREATIIGEDLHSDLAVLKVEEMPQGIQPIPLGDINKVAVGQTVVAIGNPFSYGGTLTRGIVSALGRNIPALTTFSIPQSIQTDTPINPGNSGGPLLNLHGEVIGVNAQIETGGTGRANTGVSFAIPVSIVSRVIPKLITDHKYEWSWLGVASVPITPALVKAMDLPVDKGAYLVEIMQDSPAEKAGLHGASTRQTIDGHIVDIGGDLITSIDGKTVNTFDDLMVYLALDTTPGQEITLTLLRNGKPIDVKVTLAPRPATATDINQSPFPLP
jgi:2-alkenal reductase